MTNYFRNKDCRDKDDKFLIYCYGFVAKSSNDKEMLTYYVKWNNQIMQNDSNEFNQQNRAEVKTLLKMLLTKSDKSICYFI